MVPTYLMLLLAQDVLPKPVDLAGHGRHSGVGRDRVVSVAGRETRGVEQTNVVAVLL